MYWLNLSTQKYQNYRFLIQSKINMHKKHVKQYKQNNHLKKYKNICSTDIFIPLVSILIKNSITIAKYKKYA